MGESADMILNGVLCQSCGGFIDGEETGYSRNCEDCENE